MEKLLRLQENEMTHNGAFSMAAQHTWQQECLNAWQKQTQLQQPRVGAGLQLFQNLFIQNVRKKHVAKQLLVTNPHQSSLLTECHAWDIATLCQTPHRSSLRSSQALNGKSPGSACQCH